ncbi:hypothetical protein ABIB25_005517 [Nakamurella sp. UYEF19]|uniref:hypothetical protein n=1 Tax=Nakamurella sp. UYEF19 TaxID=1756392 RepID=UPI0033973E3D
MWAALDQAQANYDPQILDTAERAVVACYLPAAQAVANNAAPAHGLDQPQAEALAESALIKAIRHCRAWNIHGFELYVQAAVESELRSNARPAPGAATSRTPLMAGSDTHTRPTISLRRGARSGTHPAVGDPRSGWAPARSPKGSALGRAAPAGAGKLGRTILPGSGGTFDPVEPATGQQNQRRGRRPSVAVSPRRKKPMDEIAEEPTQAVSPGAEPYELKYPGRSDPLMVNPFQAADAEFDPVRHQLAPFLDKMFGRVKSD